MTNELIEKGISRRVSKEELSFDMYIYNEMLALGYDIFGQFDGDEDKEYEEYASKAARYLYNGEEIPDDIREYLLSHKK